MFYDITHKTKKNYIIKTGGTHVFSFENISHDITFTIAHAKARVYIFGLYSGTGKDSFTLTTTQKHTVPGGESHVLIKGVFDDASRFTYEGLIHMNKHAEKSHATLENRNLIMSDKAHVQTKPALTILPSNVTCTHAATVSYVSQEQREALMSRGITRKEADQLLIDGFLRDLTYKKETLLK